MFRNVTLSLVVAAGALLPGLLHADDDERDRRRAERRMAELEMRLRKVGPPADSNEITGFLHRETQRLAERCRSLKPSDPYQFGRTLEAVDDLLDAREQLQAATREQLPSSKEDDPRRDTAKRLERAYFRVQQADYFARLSVDKQAPEYIPFARQLYQRARASYDAREYQRANRLASASSELVNVLENLAQAAVRRPEPPELK